MPNRTLGHENNRTLGHENNRTLGHENNRTLGLVKDTVIYDSSTTSSDHHHQYVIAILEVIPILEVMVYPVQICGHLSITIQDKR